MNYSTYRFTLDLQKHQSVMSVAVFQYDSAVRLHISLTDGGKPYLIEVSKAVFYGKRSDGTAICKDCTTIPGNAEIIYEFDALTAEVLGTVNCQIRLYGIDGSLITAPRFTIVVEPRVIDADDVIESEAERDALDAIFATEAARTTAEEERENAEYARAEAETLRVEAEAAREAAEEIRDRMRYGEWDHIITDEYDLLNGLSDLEGNILVKGLDNVLGLSQKLNEGARLIKFVDTTLQNVSLEGNQNCTIEGLRIVSAGSYASSIRNFGEVRDCNDIGGDPFDSLHIYNCNHIANCRFEHAEDCNYIDNCTVHTGSTENSILLDNCHYICGIVIEADGSFDFDPKGIFQNCSYLSNINVNASVNREKIKLIYNGCTYVDAQTCSQFIDGEKVGMVQVLTEDGSFRAINPAEEGGGEDGKDGISVTHSWNGTVLTVTSASGTSSADLKGDKGDKGDTGATGAPGAAGKDGAQGEKGEKGDPYILTPDDKNEIAQNVKGVCVAKNQGASNVGKILVVGTDGNLTIADASTIIPEGGASGDVIGTLDDSNNILLSGKLKDGTYTLKYENADGTYTEIGNLVVGAILQPVTENIALTNGIRIGSDGGDRTQAGYCATPHIDLTNIPKPCTIHLTKAKWAFATSTETGMIMYYATKADGTKLVGGYTNDTIGSGYFTVTKNGGKNTDITVTVTSNDVAKIRFSGHWANIEMKTDYGYTDYDTNMHAEATLTYTPAS